MKILYVSSRSVTVLLDESGHYEARSPLRLRLNGEDRGSVSRSVESLFGLWPQTCYILEATAKDGRTDQVEFETLPEFCTLNVRDFGAAGDGITEDTAKIQAALLCCPEGGRVLIPEGRYLTGPLFLRSGITVEIARGAVLQMLLDRASYPILPGTVRSTDEQEELILGMFEGNPLPCFAGAINGFDIHDTALIGEGVVDGRAQDSDWWDSPKDRVGGAFRGSLFYLQRCRNITVQGITFRNSPCWNLHPAFSEDLDFLNIRISAPYTSPNTDGFDPESCCRVRLLGAEISVGDDCVALKSGKVYLGRRYHIPCDQVEIAYCAMLDGHGGVTAGSEMAGGVLNVRVHHCYMRGNDRGLRIKTRRGRGKFGVIDHIRFEDVLMDGVKIPLVVNALYYCDPDGQTSYVQSREPLPVDEDTPRIGTLIYERVQALRCRGCVAYVLGLPERPVERIVFADCSFDFEPSAEPVPNPAMADGVEPVANQGILLHYVDRVDLRGTRITGISGQMVECTQVRALNS